MANISIRNAFERMWQHIVDRLGDKASKTEAQNYALDAANAVKNDLLNNAGAAYDTLKELGDLIDDNTDAIDALESVASGKADKVHSHTVSEISDLTATATELNHLDGVTSNVQTQLDSKLSTSGGTMTGEITLTQSNLVKRDKDTSSVSIYGGTESGNGATVTVYGKEQAIYAGRFALKANNGESSATLEGIPDGTLRWNGKNVVALGTSEVIPISSGGTGAANASDALSNLGGVPKTNPTLTGSFSMNKLYSSTTGSCSFVEGYNGSATGNYGAHSEGYYTEANGDRSHAEGDGSVANGIGSHAEGQETIASCDYQHVQGKYNVEDSNSAYAHIVGNGESNGKRSNAHTLDWDGNAWFAGDIFVGGASQDDVDASKVVTKADQKWNLLYDSGEISAIANSISNIDVSGYNHIQVLVRIYNDGDSINSRSGSAIFTCANGKNYQFPVWSNMFSKSINTVYTMATFNLVDGWLICPCASRLIGDATTFEDEGGTAGNLSLTGSGMMKCTSTLSTLTISSLDQNSNYYFGMGSRVMVWGWNG